MIPQPVVGSLDLPRPHRIPFQRRMTFIARIRPMKGKKGKAKGKGKKGKAGQRGLVVFFPSRLVQKIQIISDRMEQS